MAPEIAKSKIVIATSTIIKTSAVLIINLRILSIRPPVLGKRDVSACGITGGPGPPGCGTAGAPEPATVNPGTSAAFRQPAMPSVQTRVSALTAPVAINSRNWTSGYGPSCWPSTHKTRIGLPYHPLRRCSDASDGADRPETAFWRTIPGPVQAGSRQTTNVFP